jgi:hypothetical protein
MTIQWKIAGSENKTCRTVQQEDANLKDDVNVDTETDRG